MFLILFSLPLTVYASIYSSTINRKTLRKPGECWDNVAWPNTIQCAVTNRCLPIEAYRNGTGDCCGYVGRGHCPDTSDEDRIDPPGDCKHHPHYQFGMTIQCAKTKLCLSRLNQPNGLCECCGPNYDCETCDDHSDEDPCQADEWYSVKKDKNGRIIRNEKFSCMGTCRPISQLEDGALDCPYDCVEPDMRDSCQQNLVAMVAQNHIRWCRMMEQKKTNYFQCKVKVGENSVPTCIIGSSVRNGKSDCDDNSDESVDQHPDCTDEEFEANCEERATKCIRIKNNPRHIECHCERQNSNCSKHKKFRAPPKVKTKAEDF